MKQQHKRASCYHTTQSRPLACRLASVATTLPRRKDLIGQKLQLWCSARVLFELTKAKLKRDASIVNPKVSG